MSHLHSAVQNERAPRLAAKRHPLPTILAGSSNVNTTNISHPPASWTPPSLMGNGYVKDSSPVSMTNPFLNLPMTK